MKYGLAVLVDIVNELASDSIEPLRLSILQRYGTKSIPALRDLATDLLIAEKFDPKDFIKPLDE